MNKTEIIQAIKNLPGGEVIYLDTGTPSFTSSGYEATVLDTDDLKALIAEMEEK